MFDPATDPRQHACPRGYSVDIVVLYTRDEERQASDFSGCVICSHETYVLESTFLISRNGLVYGRFGTCRLGLGPGLFAGEVLETQSGRGER